MNASPTGTPPDTPIIRATNLSKTFRTLKRKPGLIGAIRNLFSTDYETIKAVDDISFELSPGELVGYIGPNGAGKSTTIKMLTGILHPTAGEIVVDGLVPQKEWVRNSSTVTQHVVNSYAVSDLAVEEADLETIIREIYQQGTER